MSASLTSLPDDLPAEWDADDRARFRAAFAASYRGLAHPGKMNRLVMTAKLTWQQVSWLRAKPTRPAFSTPPAKAPAPGTISPRNSFPS